MRALRTAAVCLPAALLAASPALASEAGGQAAMPLDQILWELGIKVLDVAIIAFFAFRFLSKPIAKALEARAAGVRAQLDEAAAGRREAEARLRELQERNARLEAEIAELITRTGVEIEREQAILIAEGEAAAARVRQHAQETIRQEVAKARAELHREAALLAVQFATANVKAQITAADQQRILDEYAASLEGGR